MTRRKTVTIIIPCFNQVRYTRMCLESIFRHTSYPYELIVIDNGSGDATAPYLRSLRRTVRPRGALRRFLPVFNRRNIGVAAALNRGIRLAKGAYVCYVNNDALVTPLWLEGLVRCAESDPKIGIVGCSTNRVRKWRGTFPPVAGLRDAAEIDRTAHAVALALRGRYEPAYFVHGFCMFLTRRALRAVGPFDEGFFPCAGEDIDYSLRAKKAGFLLVNALDVFVFHFWSKATKSPEFRTRYAGLRSVKTRASDLMIRKWGDEGREFARTTLLKDAHDE